MSRAKKYDWPAIKREWLTGKYKTMAELGRDKKIPESTLKRRAAREKWTEAKEQVEERADEMFMETAAKMLSTRQVEILESQLKYAQVMIGLGFGTLSGKTKLSKESDALRAILGGMEAQLKALEGFRKAAASEDAVPPSDGPAVNVTVNNLQVNAAQGMSNEQIMYRLKQIAEEKKRLEHGGGTDKS